MCASKNIDDGGTDVFVVTKACLIDLLAKQYSIELTEEGTEQGAAASASAEVMDYLRQSGLAHKTSISDLVQAAACFKKIACVSGTLLYRKGDPVDKVFIVLSGEFILDTGDYDESKNHTGLPFQSMEHSKCYILRRGSILGDEGMVGKTKVYQASAMSIAENSIIFEVSSWGLSFLTKRFGLEKFSALAMKEQSPFHDDMSSFLKSEVMVHSAFTSLRKCIASHNPSRGFHPSQNGSKDGTDDDKTATSLSSSSSSVFPPLPPSPVLLKKQMSSLSKFNITSVIDNHKQAATGRNKGGNKHQTNKDVEVVLRDYLRLPPAAMHHTKMIVKQVQIRELSVLRQDAKIHVEDADKELRLAKAGLKTVPTVADKRKKEILADKYQRAVGIYKNHINGGERQPTIHRAASDMFMMEFTHPENKYDSATTEPNADGLGAMISYDELEHEDDLLPDDEAELVANGMDSSVSKTEHYLFYLKLKKKKLAHGLPLKYSLSSPDKKEKKTDEETKGPSRRSSQGSTKADGPSRRSSQGSTKADGGNRVSFPPLSSQLEKDKVKVKVKEEAEVKKDEEEKPKKKNGIKRKGRAPRCSMDTPLL